MTHYNLYGYRADTEAPDSDIRRHAVPDWNLATVVGWMLDRCDTVLIERDTAPRWSTPGVVHHVCRDPGCPGGCA